jgi:hypothetical protein
MIRKAAMIVLAAGAATLSGCGGAKLNENTAHRFMVQYLYDVECADMTGDEVASKYAALDSDRDRIVSLYQQERSGIVGIAFKSGFCPHWDSDKQLAISRMIPDGDGFREQYENGGQMEPRPERVIMKDGALKITFQ